MRDPFEQVHRFVESLLGDTRPKRFRVETPEDRDALQFAVRLMAEARPDRAEPTPEFITALNQQIQREIVTSAAPSNRRGFLAAALAGLAAGLGGGLGLGRLTQTPPAPVVPAAPTGPAPTMVRDDGQWFQVAKLSQLPSRATVRFTAGALEGHLVRRDDRLTAFSALCTHLPCTLLWQDDKDDFLCPCHGVTFQPSGELKQSRRSYDPLPRIDVKVNGDDVLVWSIGKDMYSHHAKPFTET